MKKKQIKIVSGFIEIWKSKLLLTMKLTVIALCFTVFQGFALMTHGQSVKVNLKMENVSIKQVLGLIEDQTNLFFIYNGKLVDVERKVNVNAVNQNVNDVLEELFSGRNIKYEIENRQILLSNVEIISGSSVQQQKSVSGKITDQSGGSIPGVSVVVKGTTNGTITDMNGKYSLSNIPEKGVLQFSFVGMKMQEVPVEGKSTINITLVEETVGIEEVVAIGYGTQKKATLTGAVASTNGSVLMRSPATDLTNNLVGIVPGLVVVTRSGEPGNSGSILRIRGTNTLGDNNPLIVVDGIANRDIGDINASDIESISVLKDASAAIYGAQAANGVIIVTTKRGKSGDPQIKINLNSGFSQPTRYPKMANASQYATMLNEVAFYQDESGGRFQQFSEDDIQKYSDGSDPWGHPNTDWFKTVFKPWSAQDSKNISLSGGTEKMKYFLSVGSRGEDGFYENSAANYSQYNFRSNIDGQISKNISLSFDVSGRQENRNSPARGVYSIFRDLMRGKPNMPAFWPDGTPGPDIEEGNNPAVISTDATGYTKDKRYMLETNARVNITIPWVKGLSVQGNFSIDKSIQSYKLWEKPWYLYSWDGNADHVLQKNKKGFETPQLTQKSADAQSITMNAFATYERTILEEHNLKFMVGTERQSGISSSFNAFRKNYISSEIDELFAGAADQYMTNGGSSSSGEALNYFGRVNYDYSQKYLLEFVWRYDGSCKFPVGKQFGFFPGISGGWVISQENFWKSNFKLFDQFKLRASWGQTGNDRIEGYQYLSSYGFLGNNRYYVFGVNNNNKVLEELRIPNPNVTWEVANQSDLGIDVQLLQNRLTISADYFNNLRSRILSYRNASVPVSSGLTLPRENIGKVRNHGFESMVSYKSQIGKFGYNVSINGSFMKNEIVFWDETPGVPEYQRSTGRPIRSELYYNSLGIFKDQAAVDAYPHWEGARPGDIIFEDYNKDGTIDGLDMVRNEKTDMPRFTGGLSINLEYKQFDFSVLFQGAAGAQQYIFPESGYIGNYFKEFADDHWTPENINSKNPRTFNWTAEYWASQPNTYWLRSTDYVRLKNIEIGYTLPAKINHLLKINGLRVYFKGLNLFTLDKCKLQDPESDDSAGRGYPLQRIISTGLTLTF